MFRSLFFLCVLLVPFPDGRVQVSHAQAPFPIPNHECQGMWDSAPENLIVGPGRDLEVDPTNTSRLITVTSSGQTKLTHPVFTEFLSLVDSYDPGSTVTPTEKLRRQNVFLNILLVPGSPVDVAYQYLKSIGKTTAATLAAFTADLRVAWFNTYKKGGKGSFSGFEHVFVGELRKRTLKGFHNWYQFYFEKDAGRLTAVSVNNYAAIDPPLLDVGFTWHGVPKARSGFFVGPSPAFEMALFSACFLGVMGTGLPPSRECTCTINHHPVTIQAVAKTPNYNILTVYPK